MNPLDMHDKFYLAATSAATGMPFPIGAMQAISWEAWDAVYCMGGEL
jgi:hypothetical protein